MSFKHEYADPFPCSPPTDLMCASVHNRCALVVQTHLVLRELVHLVAKVFPPNLGLRADIPPGLWPFVGDPGEIHEALTHVLLNARAAMPDGGELVLSARNVEVRNVPATPIFDAQAGDFVKISVSDTGPGADQYLLRPDMGLRLARVARVLREHRGFAGLASGAGGGTTVSLLFPRAASDGVPAAPAADTPTPPKGRILIVDDEAPIRELCCRILTHAGYDVLVARDGREALALFEWQRSEIKLVLTDLAMPGLNGFTLVWGLRRSKPGLRVMVATGQGSADNFRELERLGVRQVLLKPFTSAQLLAGVARALAEPVRCEPDLFLSAAESG